MSICIFSCLKHVAFNFIECFYLLNELIEPILTSYIIIILHTKKPGLNFLLIIFPYVPNVSLENVQIVRSEKKTILFRYISLSHFYKHDRTNFVFIHDIQACYILITYRDIYTCITNL
jgi:hypothetical protein